MPAQSPFQSGLTEESLFSSEGDADHGTAHTDPAPPLDGAPTPAFPPPPGVPREAAHDAHPRADATVPMNPPSFGPSSLGEALRTGQVVDWARENPTSARSMMMVAAFCVLLGLVGGVAALWSVLSGGGDEPSLSVASPPEAAEQPEAPLPTTPTAGAAQPAPEPSAPPTPAAEPAPAAEEPAVPEPEAEPAVDEPAADEPAADEPAADEPVAEPEPPPPAEGAAADELPMYESVLPEYASLSGAQRLEMANERIRQANILRNRSECPEALPLYHRALGLLPGNGRALAGLTLCYLAMENGPQAVRWARAFTVQRPEQGGSFVLLAKAARMVGDEAAATRALEQAIEVNPRNAEAREMLGLEPTQERRPAAQPMRSSRRRR